MPTVIHTMGLGGRSLETILEMLQEARVRIVVDVRRYGSSVRHPHHGSTALHAALAGAGFGVVDLGERLGGDRPGGYAAWMGTGGFRRGLEKLEALAREGPTMILCAEEAPDRCHRRFLGEALEARGWTVAHHRWTLSERTARGHMRVIWKAG